jgi:hypothetical protein
MGEKPMRAGAESEAGQPQCLAGPQVRFCLFSRSRPLIRAGLVGANHYGKRRSENSDREIRGRYRSA